MTDFFRGIILSLLGTSLCLIAALLLLPRLRIRSGMRRVIWMLFALRLLLPFALPLPGAPAITLPERETMQTTVPTPVQPTPAPQITAPQQTGNTAAPTQTPMPAPAPQQTAPQINIKAFILAFWASGILLFAAWHITGHFLVRRRLITQSSPSADPRVTELLCAVQSELSMHRTIPIRILHTPASPMVLGILRPILFLPEESIGDDALRLILRHELLHLRRHDAAIKALLLFTHALYWFYPVVWWLRRRAELDLEFACDEAVLAAEESYTRKAYAAAIAASIRQQLDRTPALSTEFQGGWKSMKERLNLILHAPPLRSGRTAIALITALLLMVGLFAGCVQDAPKYAEYRHLPGGEYLHLIGQSGKNVIDSVNITERNWEYWLDENGDPMAQATRKTPENIFGEDYELMMFFLNTDIALPANLFMSVDPDVPVLLGYYQYRYRLESTDYQEKYDKLAEIYQEYCELLGEPAPYRSGVTIADCLETRFDAKTYTATWVLAEDVDFPTAEEDHNYLLLAKLEVTLGPQDLSVYYSYHAVEAGYSNLAGYPVRNRQTGKIQWQNGDPGVPAEHFLAFPFASDNLSYLGKSPSAAAKLLKESGENWEKVFDKNGLTGRWVREETQHFFDQDYTLSLWQDGSTVWRYSLETTVDSADAAAKTEAIRAVYDACIFSGPTPHARKDSAPTLEQGLEEGFRYSDDPGVYETWWVLRLQVTPESNLNEWRVLTCCLRVEYSADSAKISVVYELEDSSAAYDFPDLLS